MNNRLELSTSNLELWPRPQEFKRLLQTLTVLSLCQNDWECYEFREASAGQTQTGVMRNGQGDEAEIIFSEIGTLFRGFAHESPVASWYTEHGKAFKGTYRGFPKELESLKRDHLEDEDISFVTWFLKSEDRWQKGEILLSEDFKSEEDPDGSEYVMSYFPFSAEQYVAEANNYYQIQLELSAVESIYRHEPLTNALILRLNSNCKFNCKSKEFIETGYPMA